MKERLFVSSKMLPKEWWEITQHAPMKRGIYEGKEVILSQHVGVVEIPPLIQLRDLE
jgi:hypothetical protein